ncbi:gastrula zinc finger protein XlCGF8.2DB-like [Penaeus monodon]|uniref:gastrula zinc finger protein XlCGF8.2DB-like n=1 Tax=Penaeus monodon TaxID=6687 RepID=UPI0018A74C98|nr:gastrula zinc finger protein XlCGF8.2DB-like [Penaeus monodon]
MTPQPEDQHNCQNGSHQVHICVLALSPAGTSLDTLQKPDWLIRTPLGSPCSLLASTAPSYTNIQSHMRVQIKENPYSCETCNKDFSHKNNTVIHMRIHTKDKTQSCEICNKAFSQKQNLMRHMSIHKREAINL